MNVLYAPEQQSFRESVARFVSDTAAFRRQPRGTSGHFSEAIWEGLAELGCLGLGFPESAGGHGGGAVDIGIVAEELGKGLVLEPYISTVVAASAIAKAGSAQQQAVWLPRVTTGRLKLSLACEDAEAAPTCARDSGSGWTLQGRKHFVADAPLADAFVVSTFMAGDPSDPGLFLVPRDSPGLRQTAFQTLDGRLAAHLDFEQVQLDSDARLQAASGFDVLHATMDQLVTAHCSDAVGCMQVLMERTVAYTKARKQFGRPVSDNQVIRHRMVDMAIQCEEARAATLRAELYMQLPALERARAVSSTKVKICRASTFVSEGAIQLHGAMGVTDELDVGHHVRRLLKIRSCNGTERDHRVRLARLRNEGMAAAEVN